MSLYREASARSRKAIAAVFLGGVLLVVFGFAVGRTTAPEPSLQSRIAGVRDQARPVADALELVAIHYRASADAATAQLQRARTSFADVEDELVLIDPAGTTEARSAMERLSALVSTGAAASEVEQASAAAEDAVRGLSEAS